MKSIVLPILFKTEKSNHKELIGVDPDITDVNVKDMVFYHINAIVEYKGMGINGTTICSNGDEFICTYTVNAVSRLIDEAFE